MLDEAIIVFCANFGFIFLKAWQQRNVAFMHYVWVLPTSFFMAIAEIYVVAAVAVQAYEAGSFLSMWPLVLAVALGGGLGCLCSMYLHHRYLR